MQVRGQVGALLGADPLGPLGGEVGGQAVDPRPDHDAQADHGQQRGDRDVAGHLERAAAQREDHERGDDQADPGREPGVRRPPAAAEHGPDRVDPAGGVQPALALRLVGLAPQQGDADEPEEDRPEHAARARGPPRAGRRRRGRARPARSPGRRRRAGGSGPGAGRRGSRSPGRGPPPRSGSRWAAPATGRRTSRCRSHRGPRPPRTPTRTQSTGSAEVPGQAAGDAADDRLLAVAMGTARLAAAVAAARVPASPGRAWLS